VKSYYKILGVKETASEEEIREQWVKLMRRLHPDWRSGGVPEDERIKEINEAYQTLKFSSTRMKYDLKKAYDRKKRKSYIWRVYFPISLLTTLAVLIIIGFLYLKDSTNNPSLPNVLNKPNEPNDPNVPTGLNSPTVSNASMPERIDASTHQHINTSTPNRTKEPNVLNEPNGSNELNDPNVLNVSNASTPQRSNDPTPERIDVSTLERVNAPNVSNDLNEPTDDLNGFNELNVSTASTPERIDTSLPEHINEPNASTLESMTASTHQPLMATDPEIKQFFANYTERYIRRDLDGFLSLFSLRAVQNNRDGWEEIRKIYGDFFRQSKDIKYDLEDTEVESYQNGLKVKARYEITQTSKRRDEIKTWKGSIRWVLIKEEGTLKILSLDYQHLNIP
jgi:curved DNA-binding protein CbpA